MKCISCGAEIGLTDERCPHCGRILAETAGHQADMQYYKGDSEKTKKKVRKITGENVPIVISVFVLVLLVIAVCIASYVKENAYHFREDAQRRESVNKYDEYSVYSFRRNLCGAWDLCDRAMACQTEQTAENCRRAVSGSDGIV